MAKEATTKTEVKPPAEDGVTRTKQRSPNYPVWSLKRVLPPLSGLYQDYKRNWVPVGIVHEKWGYKQNSGAGIQAVAAAKSYGLLESQGDGAARKVRISDSMYQLVLQHPDTPSLLKKAALNPPIHSDVWEKFSVEGLPPDDVIRHYLVFDRGFNPDSVNGFIAQFRETIDYAKLSPSDKITDKDGNDASKEKIEIGDFVQWESQGVVQFPEPKRVAGKSDDGQWVFVEGSPTGLPSSEVRKVEPPKANAMTMTTENPAQTPPPNPHFKGAASSGGIKQDTYTTDTGSVVVQWPSVLSAEDLKDLEGWLDMLKRKIKRSVKSENPDA